MGYISLIGAGPGDPGLITLRGAERLGHADVVVYDRLANPLLLRLAPQAEWIPVGKQPESHPVPQGEINTLLIEYARQGKRVVRLKGGDPFVFGRGGEEALALANAGIQFEVVPGVTSAIAAPAYAGIPVTHREIAGSVVFVTGHRTEQVGDPEADWLRLGNTTGTLVFLMGVKNLPRIVKQLIHAGKSRNTPVALIQQGTTVEQKTVTGTLGNIVDQAAEIHSPAVIVVGEVVKLRDQIRWFDCIERQPFFGLRVLNTKSIPQEQENVFVKGIPLLDEFNNQISLLGGEVIHMPVLQIGPPPSMGSLKNAARRLATENIYTWVVFTSVNGVRFFFNELTALGYDSRCLGGIKVAAIGPITAQALQNQGIFPDFIPTTYIGAELGSQLALNPGDRVLLPRSEIALDELPQILKARGGIVDEVSAYTVQANHPDSIVLEQLVAKQIHIVAFFSPSGVSGLEDMLVEAGYDTPLSEVLAPVTVACIGPSTQGEAQKRNIHVDIVAEEHTSIGLVQELLLWRKRL